MQKISSKYTMVFKAVDFAFCLILAAAASQILFSEGMGLLLKLLLAMILVAATLLLQALSFKRCDVFLDRNRIMIKGIDKSQYVESSNITDISEHWFLYQKIVILNFNDKTSFGKTAVFTPASSSLDELKEMLREEPPPAEEEKDEAPAAQ